MSVLPAGMMLLVLPEVLHPPRCVTCHPGHVTSPPGLCSGVNPSVPLLGEAKQSPQFSPLAARRDLCTGRDSRNRRNTKNHLVPPPPKAATPPTVPPHGWVGLALDLVDSSSSSLPGRLCPHLQHLQWLLCFQRKSLGAAKPWNVAEAAAGSQLSFPAVGISLFGRPKSLLGKPESLG